MEKGADFEVRERKPDGYYCSKLHLILAVVVAIALVVLVGILAGVVPQGSSGASAGTQSTMSTSRPTAATTRSGMTQSSVGTTSFVATVRPTTPKPTSRYAAVNNIRLPKNIVPVQYWFSLDIDMLGLKFTGTNEIQITVNERTSIIIVHMKQMTLTATPIVSTRRDFGNSIQILEHSAFAPNDYYYIVLTNPINTGTYYVRFQFSAQLSTILNGLYKSTYTKLDGRVM